MTVPTRDVVAGIGFRHAARPEEIVALIERALNAADLPIARLRALATAADRAGEPVFEAVAAALAVAALGIDAVALRAVDAHVPTRSPRIEAGRGVGSLAEAAALAGAGAGATLILPRIKAPSATCALALAESSL